MVFIISFSGVGRKAASQRSANRSQWGVVVREDKPGRHGNAAQVHVNGGQQARDDSADCGKTNQTP